LPHAANHRCPTVLRAASTTSRGELKHAFHHGLQRFAGDEVDLEHQLVRLGQQLWVLQGPLESLTKGGDPCGRYLRRRCERSARDLLGQDQLERGPRLGALRAYKSYAPPGG